MLARPNLALDWGSEALKMSRSMAVLSLKPCFQGPRNGGRMSCSGFRGGSRRPDFTSCIRIAQVNFLVTIKTPSEPWPGPALDSSDEEISGCYSTLD